MAEAKTPSWVYEGTQIVYQNNVWDAEGELIHEALTTVTIVRLVGDYAVVVQESEPAGAADGLYTVHRETREIVNSTVEGMEGTYPVWLPSTEAGQEVRNQAIPCVVQPADPAEIDYVILACEVSVETEDGPFTLSGTYRYGRESRLMFSSDLTVHGQSRETLDAIETSLAFAPRHTNLTSLDAVSVSLLAATAVWVLIAVGLASILKRTGDRSPLARRAGFCTECGADRRTGMRYCLECGTALGMPGDA